MEFSKKIRFINLCQYVFLIISFFCSEFGISRDTITADHSLESSETILSNSQNFTMGIFSPANSTKYYFGIMFNVPSMDVLWVANRDKPMNDSRGSMTISEDGDLVVLDGQKRILWSSNISTSANTSAQLLDTGNLVLKHSSSGKILWESFGESSNSMVQKMKIGSGVSIDMVNELRSWTSPWDPSPGSFSFRLQPLNIPQLLIENNSQIIWRSGPWNKQIFIGLPNMSSVYNYGFEMIYDNTGGITYLTYTTVEKFLTYFLNSSGCLLERHWDQQKNQWEVTWESCATGQCNVYGKCGPFGICDYLASQSCSCLQGYKPKNEMEWNNGNWSNGCIRNAALQCDRNNSDVEKIKKDGFLNLQRVKVPDFALWMPFLEDDCRTDCLKYCSCIAYSYYTGIGCMHWSDDFIDIEQFPKGGADLYIRLAYSELDQYKGRKDNIVNIIVITLTISSLVIALCAYFGWGRLVKHRVKKQIQTTVLGETMPLVARLDEIPVFDFEIIAKATENFHSANKLGQGGFGSVYKGKLEDGQEIAVKRLSESSAQGQREFMNEVSLISKLQHRNLVRLHGCCIERGEKMLIYEFMPNRSLDALLFGSHEEVCLNWSKRFMIIEGIGRGLLYLHRDSRLRIIHRDLKASNILLDELLNPKISDFGLARIFGVNQHQANTQRVVGTYGYMAPEYAMNGRFSEKSDVYSFGVLLLEIVSGRKNTAVYDDGFAISLLAHAWKLWNEGKIEEVIDPKVYDLRFGMNMRRCVHVGLLCVQEHPNDRPNVSTVLSMLSSEIAELPPPKQPAFTERQSFPDNDSSKLSTSVYSVTITDAEGR